MDKSTLQFGYRVAMVVLGIIAIGATAAYLVGLFTGVFIFPTELRTPLIILVQAACSLFTAWLVIRSSTLQHASTKRRVDQLQDRLENGYTDKLADKVAAVVVPQTAQLVAASEPVPGGQRSYDPPIGVPTEPDHLRRSGDVNGDAG